MTRLRFAVSYAWKLPVCGMTFSVAYFAAAIVLTLARLHAPGLPPGADAGRLMLISAAASPLLAAGLAPLALGLVGSYRLRWFALALLAFISLGANTVIESSIFTTTFAHGGAAFTVLINAGAAIAFGAVLSRLFRPVGQAFGVSGSGAAHHSGFWWAGHIALAMLAFPVIYFTFGIAISPIVLAYYRAGVPGFVVPSFGTMLWVQMVRSTLFLLASAPAIFLWKGSRMGLIAALGWAYTVTVGLNGLLVADWIPTVLRVTHSLEVTADSFVYAALLVLLFKPRAPAGIEDCATRASTVSAGA